MYTRRRRFRTHAILVAATLAAACASRPSTLARQPAPVVIDGMRYLKNGAEMLASISPRELKRIEVLRDAASIAGFASAATGGVVVVTTWRH
jgi:hypothetical protein